jgi:hypothetical protein
MPRKTRNTLERTSSKETSVNGLTLTRTTTEEITFTLPQLKRAVTAEKMFMTGINREDALKVLAGLVREHRYDIWGTAEGYTIITNGYGQFKHIRTSHSNPLDADRLFELLEKYHVQA